MSYLSRKVLLENENVVVKPKKNGMFVFIALLGGILGCWMLLIPTFKAIKAIIKFCSTDYAVTEKRILTKHGIVATHTNDMALSKVENLIVDYTFFGKIFNYGTVKIHGAGFNHVTFSYIKNAEQVKRQIAELL